MDDLESMVADGSLELAAMSDEGEPMYVINDKCKELHPEFWQSQYGQFQQDLSELWNAGYINISFGTDSVDDEIILTSKSFEPGDDLDSRLKGVLSEIVRIIQEEEGWVGE